MSRTYETSEFKLWLESDMRITPNRINLSIANQIYDILQQCCGAQDHTRENFLVTQTEPYQRCKEFRFCGSLGFGGKFWEANRKWYVTCYPEDATPDRMQSIMKANILLDELHLKTSLQRIQSEQWQVQFVNFSDDGLYNRLNYDEDVCAVNTAYKRSFFNQEDVLQFLEECDEHTENFHFWEITLCGLTVAIDPIDDVILSRLKKVQGASKLKQYLKTLD